MIHGLKLVAVAIVAQAVWGMARALCPDRQRAVIGSVAALLILSGTSPVVQVRTMLMGGMAGLGLCRAVPRRRRVPRPRRFRAPLGSWRSAGSCCCLPLCRWCAP
jgi:chromate transport protein ChrA